MCVKSRSATLAVATMLGLLAAGTAQAAVTLRISESGSTNGGNNSPTNNAADNAFEYAGGSLQTTYGLTTTAGSPASYLTPIERAVGQLRSGNSDRRGLHLPSNSTGRPVDDSGTGVLTALTNFGAYQSATTDFASGTLETFRLDRTGNVISFTFGSNVLTSDARTSLGNINAFEIRIRSAPLTTETTANGISFTNLVFTQNNLPQTIGNFSAFGGNTSIGLWDGIGAGDFSLAGQFAVSWAGTRPGGSQLAAQVKLLQVPVLMDNAIPEPASWAMLIAGFGLTGAAMRRRRAAIA